MFTQIDLKGLRKSVLFGYAADLPFFKGRRKLEFKPGLNVLFGPNGSGKSTVLRILGETMCATQGGISAITETVITDTIDFGTGRRGGAMADKIGLQVTHDGQPVIYCDPRQTVGMVRGHFDDDFFSAGMDELKTRGSMSHGQASASRMNVALAVLDGKAEMPTAPIVRVKRANVNDVWRAALLQLEERIKASAPKGQFTVLLDEPESNYSLEWQSRLWDIIARPDVAARVQVIVASHSPFVMGLPHANYIDMVPGYRIEMQDRLIVHFNKVAADTWM